MSRPNPTEMRELGETCALITYMSRVPKSTYYELGKKLVVRF